MMYLTFDSDEELVKWINKYVKTHPDSDEGINFLNRCMNNKDLKPPYTVGFTEDRGLFLRDRSNRKKWKTDWWNSKILTYFHELVNKDEN